MPTDDSSLPPIIVSTDTPAPLPPPDPTPWGFWATVGFSALIAIAFAFAQSLGLVIYIALTGGLQALKRLDPNHLEDVVSDGKALVAISLLSAPITIALCVLFAWLRRGITVREYLALRWPSWKTILKWAAGCLLFLILLDIGTSFIKGEATENFMRQTLQSVGPLLPLLWIVLVVAAPLSEEIFFRGFLFAGIANSRLGPYGAIAITSLLFMAIHLQYDLQGLIFVFFLGLILATARWKTGSLPLCMMLHAMMNFIATISFLFLDK
jgi:membrane protease YdiL (CAAX protease family)